MKQSKTRKRCPWVPEGDELYEAYHDREWGVPVHDDRVLFEFLLLESAQAGLSWRTILAKRENYRKAFAGFDVVKVSKFTARDVARLMNDAGIVRNRLKIQSAISNARAFLDIQDEFGSFSSYMWSFVGKKPIVHSLKKLKDYPTSILEAESFAADMKKRGFKFFGPTICYAYMQAIGMVNDHTVDCFRYKKV